MMPARVQLIRRFQEERLRQLATADLRPLSLGERLLAGVCLPVLCSAAAAAHRRGREASFIAAMTRLKEDVS